MSIKNVSIYVNNNFSKPSKAGPKSEASECNSSLEGAYGFVRPDPEAGRDADDQRHKVFEHEDAEVRRLVFINATGAGATLVRGRAGEPSTPRVLMGHFVSVAAEQYGCRHAVQHAEDTDADHQLFQFLRLGSTLGLQHSTNPSQT